MIDGILSSETYVAAKKLLDVSAMRHAAIASNLANVETPGYKRMDVSADFETQLRAATSHNNIDAIRDIKPSITLDPNARAVRADGNNVSMDYEMMQMNKNAVEYEFLTQYLSNNINRIKSAISTNPSS